MKAESFACSNISQLILGLNFPLSHLGPSSKLSQGSPSPWKQPSLQSKPSTTTSTSVIDDKNDDIQIIEEEEEVLIDDFDGQCCRTYPYNHSKIQRWREERRKKNEERRIKEHKKDHDHRDTSKHVDNAGVVKVPTTSIESSVSSSKQSCDTITTTAGNIITSHTLVVYFKPLVNLHHNGCMVLLN